MQKRYTVKIIDRKTGNEESIQADGLAILYADTLPNGGVTLINSIFTQDENRRRQDSFNILLFLALLRGYDAKRKSLSDECIEFMRLSTEAFYEDELAGLLRETANNGD